MNIIEQTIKFMNEANRLNAFAGRTSVWPGFTGMMIKNKRLKAKNDGKSAHQMRRIHGAKHHNGK